MLVYDLGGGTLDVTVFELFEGVVEVKSSCGNNSLGGKDSDQAIMDHIAGVIKNRGKAMQNCAKRQNRKRNRIAVFVQ
jgi:molecular chaperone DnaK (HSP70)